MDSIGSYEYSKKDLIGHGAFAIVYKGIFNTDIHLFKTFKTNFILFIYLGRPKSVMGFLFSVLFLTFISI